MLKIIINYIFQKDHKLQQNILIDVYSDTVCPWCYIGFNILKKSMQEFNKINFNVTWRPFQLNPKIDKSGMDRQSYLEKKFNGKENAKKIYDKINTAGKKNEIYFQFEKIKNTPNSFPSHKLLALSHKLNIQTEVVETLFYSYFIEGVDIGNFDELINIAKQHGIYDENTLNYLQSEKDNKNLLAEEEHARQLGVQGVPCFIINKEYVLFGAQNKNKFLEIFKKILDEN